MRMSSQTYTRLLRTARRHACVDGDAEDLLQNALVAAIEVQRADMSLAENEAWLGGVLRNKARQDARSAVRRRRRERIGSLPAVLASEAEVEADPVEWVQGLPRVLRTTALLILSGHTRTELVSLLSISDVTLRKRISDLRRRSRGAGRRVSPADPLRSDLAYGQLRAGLLRSVKTPGVVLGSHDPDGHLFLLSSRNGLPRQQNTYPIGNGDEPCWERLASAPSATTSAIQR